MNCVTANSVIKRIFFNEVSRKGIIWFVGTVGLTPAVELSLPTKASPAKVRVGLRRRARLGAKRFGNVEDPQARDGVCRQCAMASSSLITKTRARRQMMLWRQPVTQLNGDLFFASRYAPLGLGTVSATGPRGILSAIAPGPHQNAAGGIETVAPDREHHLFALASPIGPSPWDRPVVGARRFEYERSAVLRAEHGAHRLHAVDGRPSHRARILRRAGDRAQHPPEHEVRAGVEPESDQRSRHHDLANPCRPSRSTTGRTGRVGQAATDRCRRLGRCGRFWAARCVHAEDALSAQTLRWATSAQSRALRLTSPCSKGVVFSASGLRRCDRSRWIIRTPQPLVLTRRLAANRYLLRLKTP
jgi:hypothetical protein